MLFNNTETVGDEGGLKEYLGGIQKAMFWQTWKPFVAGAEQTYLIPVIGQGLYDELIETTGLDAYQQTLKVRLKQALAWYAYLDAMPSLVSTTGDQGLAVATPDKSQAVSKWLYVELKKTHQDKADRYLESALAYLEIHADRFPTWKESEVYTVQNGQLIRNTNEGTRFFPAIQNSRRLFLAIRDYFNQAEEEYIVPILGEELYTTLMDKQKAGSLELTTQEALVLKMARKAVVQYGFSLAVPFININPDLRLVSETDGIINEGVLSNERLNNIRNGVLEKAQERAAELRNYLNNTASETVLSDYYNSSLYVAPANGGFTRQLANDSSNPYFIL